MKKVYLSVCICIFYFVSTAQVKFVSGGLNSATSETNIISFDTTGAQALLHSFVITDPTSCGRAKVANGKVYGTTEYGGTNNLGVIFSINPDGSGFKTIYSFKRAVIKHTPELGPDGKLYIVISDSLYNFLPGGSALDLVGSIAPGCNEIVIDVDGWVYGLGFFENITFVFKIKNDGTGYKILQSLNLYNRWLS